MLSGIFSRWKYTVAFYFTPDSMRGDDLKPIVEEILERAEEIGIRVNLIASDMGSVNGAMWKAFGVCIAGRNSKIINSVPHPCDPFRKLWFCPDSGHLFKNLKWALLNNKIIELPQWFVKCHNLSSSTVRCEHISELAQFQEDSDLLMAPKITINELALGNFAKMKVNKAVNFLSSVTSSSLSFLADEDPDKQEYRATASFIEVVSKWFHLVSSRSHKFALGYIPGDEESEFKYIEAVAFLQDVMRLFQDMKIGQQGLFKPVQRGVLLTTKTILELADWLIEENNYRFVLTGRFSTDCVENMFSCIRAKQPIPTAVQFKQNLKVVTVSKYLRPVNNSSYNADDCVLVGNFLKNPKSKPDAKILPALQMPNFSSVEIVLDDIQLSILYYNAGYIFSRILNNNSICKECIDSAGSSDEIPNIRHAKFTKLKRFREGTLFFVNEEVFDFFKQMEIIFRQNIAHIRNIQSQGFDAVRFFKEKFINIPCEKLKTCHGIKLHAISRFVTFRLRIAKQKIRAQKKTYNSKTMAMHTTVL